MPDPVQILTTIISVILIATPVIILLMWIAKKEVAVKLGLTAAILLLATICLNQLTVTAKLSELYEQNSKIEYLGKQIQTEMSGLKNVITSSVQKILDALNPLKW